VYFRKSVHRRQNDSLKRTTFKSYRITRAFIELNFVAAFYETERNDIA
jgi:hypothetical protein